MPIPTTPELREQEQNPSKPSRAQGQTLPEMDQRHGNARS